MSAPAHQQAVSDLVRTLFTKLVANGMNPNEAAAQAIIAARNQMEGTEGKSPAPAPVPAPAPASASAPAPAPALAPPAPPAPAAPPAASQESAVDRMEIDEEEEEEEEEAGIGLPRLRTMLEAASALQEAGIPGAYRETMGLLNTVFGSVDELNSSFQRVREDDDAMDLDDGDTYAGADLDAVHKAFSLVVGTGHSGVSGALRNGIRNVVSDLCRRASAFHAASELRVFVILFEAVEFWTGKPDLHLMLGQLCRATAALPAASQERLVGWWSALCEVDPKSGATTDASADLLRARVGMLTAFFGTQARARSPEFFAVARVLGMLHGINMLPVVKQPVRRFPSCHLRVKPVLPFDAFYSDKLNDQVDQEWISWYQKQKSIVDTPFLLDTASKARCLTLNAEVQMRRNFEESMRRSMLAGQREIPYLVLKVRRAEIVHDTLQQIAQMPRDALKKGLKVKFIGEEGVDEGGVQKEFFQVIMRELFDPSFGMFTTSAETRTFWFNGATFEPVVKFELIGILMGVAIFNSVILDMHFPKFLYAKLMGVEPDLDALAEINPGFARGLRQLLSYPADGSVDIEATCDLRFDITVESFGSVKEVPLKPGGEAIAVTAENREEYVDLAIKYYMIDSVKKQWDAFAKGFLSVCDGKALKLFRPEELELLVCGSHELDFEALEQATRYEDGFEEDDAVIQHFWSVVHEFSLEQKKKLLAFATGSDRVPINGLAKLRFVISKNGPDSNRLPTSHTCFNHLLLPNYSTREKLKQSLLTAINQSEGFGLL